MGKFLTPPTASKRQPASEVGPLYHSLRLRVFLGIYIGYAAYYLVRKNLSLALPYLSEDFGYTKTSLGFALACNGIGYGISKFVMGGISDRSDARKFLPLGLILASLAILVSGTKSGVSSVFVIGVLQFLIGWFGGMGWPPCGRVMTHWFSAVERGRKMAIWNTAHNLGGMLIGPLCAFATGYVALMGFQHPWMFGMFGIPALIAIVIAIAVYFLIRDSPQSCGLPSIEEHTGHYPHDYSEDSERILGTREIFVKYVFCNKILWIVALANAFVYLVRYGVLDWAPTYLREVKHYDIKEVGWAYFAYEFAAIPGTLVCGWISDVLFKGKRAVTTVIFMLLVAVFVMIYWQNESSKTLDIISLIAIGFLIYGPVMLIGVHALDLAPKNAAGASAGFTGFFGYFVGTALLSNFLMGYLADQYGWDVGFQLLIGACIVSSVLMLLTIPDENRKERLRLERIHSGSE